MGSITTIKISTETKQRLDRLKEHPRETYEEVLKKILFVLNISKKDPDKAAKLLKRLDSMIKRKEAYKKGKANPDDEDDE
ncbi:MAG: hypothetical protein WC867_08315 [Candidatus Pacearchaeota archaeon]|jgi:hypothetical protein